MAGVESEESSLGGSASHNERSSLLVSGSKADGHLFFHGDDAGDEDETDLVVSGRTAALVTFNASRKRSFVSRHRGIVAVVLALAAAGVIGVVIYFSVDNAEDHREEPLPSAQPIIPTTGPVATCGYNIEPDQRIDCFPDTNAAANETSCQERACCWDESAPAQGNGVLGQPACFYPAFYGYRVSEIKNIPSTPNAFQMILNNNGSMYPSPFPDPIHRLRVEVYQETDYRLRIKILDDASSRYEVPLDLYNSGSSSAVTRQYSVSTSSERWAFSISVRRKGGAQIFNTSLGALIYSNQYLQITNQLPSKYIYGLGEHVDKLLHSVNWTRLTLFSRDAFPGDASWNLYGVQPLYMCVEPDGSAHGVLLRNSNAMDIILSPAPAITYRTIGGVLDFYIFTGPTPDNVVQQYTELVGRPFFPPYWSLGFHLCRWGYQTSNHTMEVVKRMRAAKMPYDTQWNDIDYMRDHLDFTYDRERFATLPQLVADLHQHGQHYVMIVDPGIANSTDNYVWYQKGLDDDIFIKDSTGTQPIIGKVWPGTTAFPDFTHPNAQGYWTSALRDFHDQVPFDGVWIDMNEPSNFVAGSVDGCPESTYNNPPYVPAVLDGQLYAKTLCMTARQSSALHYNVHSLYGHTESNATMSAVRSIRGKRSLVISRSTFSGSGNHTGHWLGDNDSSWPDLAESIPGILDFSIFGIPLIGADICGFRGNSTEELCLRWMQLGSFYPFSRNHNIIGMAAQDPAAPRFSESFRSAVRSALEMRYRLLPYLYTLFYGAATTGASVARPLFFQYPTDAKTLGNDKQFLWGSDLLISPVLQKGATKVSAYIPGTTWYDIRTGVAITGDGSEKTLDAPLNTIPLHIRAGAIIPTQFPNVTTNSSRANPFGVIVAIGDDGAASGRLYIDDGETLDWYSKKQYTLVDFAYTSTPAQLTSNVEVYGYHEAINMHIRDFLFYGFIATGNITVTIHQDQLPPENVVYDAVRNVLQVTVPTTDHLKQPVGQDFTMTWTVESD